MYTEGRIYKGVETRLGNCDTEGFLHEQRVYTGKFTLAENVFWLMFLHESMSGQKFHSDTSRGL